MRINKTNFCERFFNLDPKIRIYDLDGTIIDSSHRARHDENGKLDLDHWKRNNTKENIFKDDLLPMYWQLVPIIRMATILFYAQLEKWENGIMNIYTQWVFITIGFYQDQQA